MAANTHRGDQRGEDYQCLSRAVPTSGPDPALETDPERTPAPAGNPAHSSPGTPHFGAVRERATNHDRQRLGEVNRRPRVLPATACPDSRLPSQPRQGSKSARPGVSQPMVFRTRFGTMPFRHACSFLQKPGFHPCSPYGGHGPPSMVDPRVRAADRERSVTRSRRTMINSLWPPKPVDIHRTLTIFLWRGLLQPSDQAWRCR
mgnify:FL=1